MDGLNRVVGARCVLGSGKASLLLGEDVEGVSNKVLKEVIVQ